jgi:hypothetical protein
MMTSQVYRFREMIVKLVMKEHVNDPTWCVAGLLPRP